MSDEGEGSSTVKILLSIVGVIFFIARIAMRCSNDNNDYQATTQYENSEYSQAINKALIEQQREASSEAKDFLYMSYKELDTISDDEKYAAKVIKLDKDSTVYIDLQTKINVLKGSYFQNLHNDSLQMAIKTPDDVDIFIHSFEKETDLENCFKEIKKSKKLRNYVVDINKENTKLFSYEILPNDKKLRGYALAVEKENYATFIEFESSKKSKDEIKLIALQTIKKMIN